VVQGFYVPFSLLPAVLFEILCPYLDYRVWKLPLRKQFAWRCTYTLRSDCCTHSCLFMYTRWGVPYSSHEGT